MVDTAGEVSTTSLFLSLRFDHLLPVADLPRESLPVSLLVKLCDLTNESGKMFLKSSVVIILPCNNCIQYN